MIGGIGHDVQKIKIRLEELQRDVSLLRSPFARDSIGTSCH